MKILYFLTSQVMTSDAAVGYVLCGTYPSVDSSASIFNGHITQWIKALYSIAVVLNSITTGLLIYRIWTIHKESPSYRLGNGKTAPIVRLLIDSGALQLPCEVILLALYASGLNAQYIMLECITPIVVSRHYLLYLPQAFNSCLPRQLHSMLLPFASRCAPPPWM